YVEYWGKTAGSELKLSFAKYADVNSALINASESGITGALDDYGKKLIAALERIGAADAANTLKAPSGVVTAECKDMLALWAKLDNAPRRARLMILGLEPADFRAYFVATARNKDGFVAKYW